MTANPSTSVSNAPDSASQRVSLKATEIAEKGRRLANDTLDSARGKVDELAERLPAAASSAAVQISDLTHRGVERATAAGAQIRDQVSAARERTAGYVKDQPLKSILIAATTGAIIAIIASLSLRERGRH